MDGLIGDWWFIIRISKTRSHRYDDRDTNQPVIDTLLLLMHKIEGLPHLKKIHVKF
jgi:hypothetical protein